MDILRKMFKNIEENGQPQNAEQATGKDEFRKPQWFEEAETDDELFDDDRKFAFQIFTNPMELQKHFERQMQQILESINEMEGNNDGKIKIDKNLKEDFLKPGFEDSFFKELDKESKKFLDTDLDGEIYADQLHSLIQRLNPNDKELPNVLPRNDSPKRQVQLKKKKLTDEEIIMGKIHGTIVDEQGKYAPRTPKRPEMLTPVTPMLPRSAAQFGGVFDGNYQGPKMFRQSVVSKTVRKPDGSYETTKITEDSQGNRRTTVTRTIDGKSETITTYDGIGGAGSIKQKPNEPNSELQSYSDRNVYVTKEGYAMPRNLW